MTVSGKFLVRSRTTWLLERLSAQQATHLLKLSNPRIWKAPFARIPKNVSNFSLMSSFPEGRLGNRFLEMAAGISALRLFNQTTFIMLHRPITADEELFVQTVAGVDISVLECSPDKSIGGDLDIQGPSGFVILQADFLNGLLTGFPPSKSIMQSFSSIRESVLLGKTSSVKEEVVLHFRASDRLEQPSSRQYRPAPLSFFEMAAVMSLGPRGRIRIVTDDPHSTIVTVLRERLEGLKFEVAVQSSSLKRDFQTLLSGKTLILSGSSLGDAAAGLSHSLERVFVFDRVLVSRGGIEVIELFDPSGRWDELISGPALGYRERVEEAMQSFPRVNLHYHNGPRGGEIGSRG